MKKAVCFGMKLGVGLATLCGLLVVGLVGLGGQVKPPAMLSSVSNPFGDMDLAGLPAVKRYRARDGVALAYRAYYAGAKQVAVLIHGSAGSSSDMHLLAQALQRAGITVYVPDLRGHGDNLPHGDISYVGQLDDDMADLLRCMKPKYPDAIWTLVGFSSGGGFALRIAAGALGTSFDRYVLLSPYLRYDAPTERSAPTNLGGGDRANAPVWFKAYTARIIGLMALNLIGVHRFDGLPVLAFAVPANVPSVTEAYSWRMLRNFGPHDDFRADICSVSRPMTVLVGESDELFLPDKFKPVFDAERNDIPVVVIPGLGHADMVTNPRAIQAVVAVVQRGLERGTAPAGDPDGRGISRGNRHRKGGR